MANPNVELAEVLAQLDTHSMRAVVGFDGFVDEMCRVVASRTGPGPADFDPVPSIADLGRMVSDATGRSFGRELVIERTDPGGNAPNLASGLLALGVQVDFFGTLGRPRHAVYDEFATRCASCTSLGTQHGRTLALEFTDGKLMLNITAGLAELDGPLMRRVVEQGDYSRACRQAGLIAWANWSRYPHMTACWRVLVEGVIGRLTHRPWLLLDLADPAGRTDADVRDMAAALALAQRGARVVLGMNLNEATVVGQALGPVGRTGIGDDGAAMAAAAASLRPTIGTEHVVIHSRRRAAAAWSNASAWVQGWFTDRPVRTTGVGDRFNAGYGLGLLAGLEPRLCLGLGCAAGGWFVRAGTDGGVADLAGLCRQVQHG